MVRMHRARIIAGFLLLAIGLVGLAFAVGAEAPIPPIRIGSHSYLRLVPAPWWQSASFGTVFLVAGGCLLRRSRDSGGDGSHGSGPVA